MLRTDDFSARLNQAKSATQNDIVDFVRKAYFTSNKTKHFEVENKQKYLPGEIKLISLKGLRIDLIGKGCSIINGPKYFSEMDHLWSFWLRSNILNVVILGGDMRSSVDVDNKKMRANRYHIRATEVEYNFTEQGKKVCITVEATVSY